MATTRELVRDFQLAFERPVRESFNFDLSLEDRLLLGKLLFEEVVETLVKGLGLMIIDQQGGETVASSHNMDLLLDCEPGAIIDPVEIVDGGADVNVVNHFMAHWIGYNLDRATEIVHDSNMSKLAADGTPIINGVTPGYMMVNRDHLSLPDKPQPGYDPNKPIGKILKGPNFYEPKEKLAALIQEERNNRG